MKIIIILILSLIIGYLFSKLIPFKYTDNTKSIINNLQLELKNIESSNLEDDVLIKRKEEIISILKKFNNEVVFSTNI